MNLNKTDITIILDRSGSMATCKPATIDAVNEFVNGQKQGVGDCYVSLVQFDSLYMPTYSNVNARHVVPLNASTYTPEIGGSTSLREAIGRTIDAVGQRLNSLPEHEKPGTVMIVIQTDGQENTSAAEWSQERINKMIARQRDVYNWNFVFLGANMDAIAAARSYGLATAHALSYNKEHSVKSFQKMSANTNQLRSAKSMGFADATYEVKAEDRKEAVGETS